MGLTKLEVFNLDRDGDGAPDVDDMELTFRYCMPAAGTLHKGQEAMDALVKHHDLSFFDKVRFYI